MNQQTFSKRTTTENSIRACELNRLRTENAFVAIPDHFPDQTCCDIHVQLLIVWRDILLADF
jgi:hypothetical protein